jgi:hypothetical protein
MPGSQHLMGLFLGAGASYEIGMPLAWELTEQLRARLNGRTLRALNEEWRVQSGGYADEVIADFALTLALPDFHYESLLGYLEVQQRRSGARAREYLGLYSWLLEVVYQLLRVYHTEGADFIAAMIDYYEGIARLAAVHRPLWIFSLNQDVAVECLAARYGIPLQDGFREELVFPRRDEHGRKIGELKARMTTAADMDAGMRFPEPGSYGINLLKIHGGLNIFVFHGERNLVKVLPLEPSVAGVLEALRVVDEELPAFDAKKYSPVAMRSEVKTPAAPDWLRGPAQGRVHHYQQGISSRLLDHFRTNIHRVGSLACIGYSFGDLAINMILQHWLEVSEERRLEIVAPGARELPGFLQALRQQVELVDAPATEYLDRAGGIIRKRREILEKRLGLWLRQQRDRSQASRELAAFLRQDQRAPGGREVAPPRDETAGYPVILNNLEQFASGWASERESSYENSLEAFLDAQEKAS